HEHLGGKILRTAVEDDAGDVDGAGLGGPVLVIELQGCQAMLAIDDEILPAGFLQVAHVLKCPHRTEVQPLGCEQQDGPGNGWLAHRRFVEVLDGPNLGAPELPLKGLIVALDLGDELGNLIVIGHFRRRDLLALAIEAAHEADFAQQVFGRVGDEVEQTVLLTNLRGEHRYLIRMVKASWAPLVPTVSAVRTGPWAAVHPLAFLTSPASAKTEACCGVQRLEEGAPMGSRA